MTKTVAIIGAGPCGLGAAKSCLEDGLKPTVFEKMDKIGGLWNYNDDTSEDTKGRLYKSLVTNTSTIMTCFSDFPFPRDVPPYPRHPAVLKYFNDYADHFNLRDHIELNTEVVKVEPAEDYDGTGKWSVSTRQLGQDVVNVTFDNVMICTGPFTEPFIPTIPCMSQFLGDILHTSQFREGGPFADKRVLVVGGSFSACDVAVETCNPAVQVYLSVRRGFWVFPRWESGGLPFDTLLFRRMPLTLIPGRIRTILYERSLQRIFDYDVMGIKPERPVFQETNAINDFLFPQIICGKIKVVSEIQKFLPNGVEFTDGTRLDGIDTVIFGTGYNIKTPFIDDSLLSDDINTRDLYKYVFPIRLPHPTLACIGLFPPDSGATPIGELQSRWAVRIFQGKDKLPPIEQMKNDIAAKAKGLLDQFGRPKFVVAGRNFKDELANMIGCYPSLKRLFLRDPRLAINVFFAPVASCTYRLLGPHPWPGARDEVMNCWDACVSGIEGPNSYKVRSKAGKRSWMFPVIAAMTVVVFIVSLVLKYEY